MLDQSKESLLKVLIDKSKKKGYILKKSELRRISVLLEEKNTISKIPGFSISIFFLSNFSCY